MKPVQRETGTGDPASQGSPARMAPWLLAGKPYADLCHRIAPVVICRNEVSDTVDTRVNVDMALTVRRVEALSCTDEWRSRDADTEFVIGFAAGVVGGRKQGPCSMAPWLLHTVKCKEDVVAGHQHGSDTEVALAP